MFGIRLITAALLAATTLSLAASPTMTGIPARGGLEFTVLRDGDEVGSHVIRFHGDGPQIRVDIQTRINVRLPLLGLSVYHFDHEGHEVWRDGSLVALESVTDDDGETKVLKVRREAGVLRIEGSSGAHASDAAIMPASLWHPDLVTRGMLLNTLDGHEMPVSVTEQGSDEVPVGDTTVMARHFLVSGGLNRELWYDAKGVLVKVAFAASDDSRIEYVLR
jgi:hypothetical protein